MKIEIESVRVVYDSQAVLRGISFVVESGQKLCIAGSSGSGKSSVLRSILGFVVPAKGSIRIGSVELTGKTVWNLRRQIGYVPQEADLGEGTVGEVIDRPFSFRANHAIAGNVERVGGLLERFGLPEAILTKEISSLSGGEKQRIALIIAILLDRPILLLDEISSALDPASKQAVVDYLSGAKQTVLLVSHDPALQGVCERVISLNDLNWGDGQ